MSATDRASLTPEKAEALKLIYENELLGTCGGHVSSNATSPVDWKEFKNYAEAKEVGTHTRCCCAVPVDSQQYRIMDNISRRVGSGWKWTS
jgi:hypothetical protein